ncbi:hypothetical protein ACFVT5_10295 [Streptomyces sp. NPDC058001]|uniref:hypothetical protein n=1 Tax=Streptomyces sp. NPDC058001 TaxID=3346300 RepID=UPI0036F0329D
MFAVWLPADSREYRQYGGAESCAERLPVEAWEDCLRTVSFTVDKTVVKDGGRNPVFEATVSGAPFWNGVVRFGDPGPLLTTLRPGDKVTGTVWRGDITVLSKGDLRQSSSDEPRDEPQMTAAIGTFAGLLAALGVGMGAVRTARPGGYEPFTWRSYGKPLLITIGITCVGVGLPAVWIGIPWEAVPTVAVLIVATVAWQLYRHRSAGKENQVAGPQLTELP